MKNILFLSVIPGFFIVSVGTVFAQTEPPIPSVAAIYNPTQGPTQNLTQNPTQSPTQGSPTGSNAPTQTKANEAELKNNANERIIAKANKVLRSVDYFNKLADKLETKINKLQKKGKDVKKLQARLAHMRKQIADAKVSAESAKNMVPPQTLKDARNKLHSAHKALKRANKDKHELIHDLHIKIKHVQKNKKNSSPEHREKKPANKANK